MIDEKSAIQWLRSELEKKPQTYQEIHPKFLRELHKARHEKLPELSELLEQNFLKDDYGRWYVPDPAGSPTWRRCARRPSSKSSRSTRKAGAG